ncbi:MAG TPA: twin-arginine translocase subunit TatC [Solirubrobacteraceae bacterium]|jgi:sec-independent protein translocase protein TatC|nr:twin-arginine translocase subunit TatC [Solirubrobacteraceae bacterium]
MKLRPIGHEDRLSIIDHLDELRTRLIICVGALLVVFCICFWQNHPLLNALNKPLPAAAKSGLGNQPKLDATLGQTLQHASFDVSKLAGYLADSKGVKRGAVTSAQALSRDLHKASVEYPKTADQQEKPIVIGVGEGFTTTMLIAAYFALLFTLPLILYQVYAFVLPALSKQERRVATPTMIVAPLLFVMGAVFTYFAILPPAIHFLQGYNNKEFQVLVSAGSFYKFEILLLMGIGLAFQVPLLALGLQKVGVISASTLTLNWRYALVLIAVIVAALPGVDPVTMTMETLPLVGLYVASIVMLKWVEHRNHRRALAEASRAAKASDSGVS